MSAKACRFAQFATAKLPVFDDEVQDIETLSAVLSLQPEDLLAGRIGPQIVSCGRSFLLVPLQDRPALQRARCDLGRCQTLLPNFAGVDMGRRA